MTPPTPELAAVDAHVDAADGGPPIHRYRPRPSRRSMVGAPVEEITVHRLPTPDHWHLVTRGLSDGGDGSDADEPSGLGETETDEELRPGWGFELTFRVEAEAGDDLAGGEAGADPGDELDWAVNLLTNLAAYVWSSGHPFAEGHHLDLRGPIKLDTNSPITAAVVVLDPALGVLQGPAGAVEFLQVVGLRAEELELCRSWSTEGVIDMLGRHDPLLICRLERASLLDEPSQRDEVASRAAGDGSALTELRVGTLRWGHGRLGRSTSVEMGSGAAAALGPALRRELIADGASFRMIGDSQEVRFVMAEQPAWSVDGATLEVAVPAAELEGLAALFDGRTGRGRRQPWPGLRWRVGP